MHQPAGHLADEEGSSLTHAHLEGAIRVEFHEIGNLAETGTLEQPPGRVAIDSRRRVAT